LTIAFSSKKRRPLTLLEITIGLFLTSILLVFLFGFFRQVTMENIEAAALDEKHFPMQKIEMRLSTLLSCVMDEEKGKPSSFYTLPISRSPSHQLLFCFQNEMDADPLFTGKIRALVTLEKGSLELHLLPLEDKGKTRKELLMDHVKAVTFDFFDLDGKDWSHEWTRDMASLPAMMRINITQENKEVMRFIFFLPPSEKPVVYS